ncbi:hypothetical protein RYX36_037032 [Vicia faba]
MNSLKKEARVLMVAFLYNIRPHSHPSSIPMETACLLSYILDKKLVDAARLIANELNKVALGGTRYGDRIHFQLTYFGLIMNLCKKSRVPIPSESHQVIQGVTNDQFIERYYVLRAEAAPIAAAPPAHMYMDPSSAYNMAMHEAYRRDFLFMHDFMQ